jgi:hypothetical protein
MNTRWSIVVLAMGMVLMESTHAQQGYSYKEYSRDVCIATERAYSRIPDDVFFQVQIIDNNFWVIFNDEKWFDDFFSGQGGNLLSRGELSLGVQLVSTDYFSCSRVGPVNYEDFFYQLEPLSYRQLKRLQVTASDGTLMIPLGGVPQKFFRKEFDHGLVISRRDRECIKHWYTKTPVHDWDLLEQALLIDTLVFLSDPIVIQSDYEPIVVDTRLDHDVIFPKNETTFAKDSLRGFLQNIPTLIKDPVKVRISAFASIEGPEDRNKELYRNRGEVIYNEIALVLPPNVEFDIQVDENWEDFYRDVSRSEWSSLQKESPEQIRERLKEKQFSDQLEPLLKKHRKATVSVFMQRTVDLRATSPQNLMNFYVETIQGENVEHVLKIQDAIFARMQNEEVTFHFPDTLPMPPNKAFGNVFNRDYIFRHQLGLNDQKKTYELFYQLRSYYPDNAQIRYNLAELMFRRWLASDESVTLDTLLSNINTLDKYGVPPSAHNRLLINYHLASIKVGAASRDQRMQTRSARAVSGLYATAHIREPELINLARFFVAHRQNDLAERLLRPFARGVTQPDEDLLYYYIMLTINDNGTVNTRWYNDLLDKAQQMNPQRFCNLFQPVSAPDAAGISLLFKIKLKEVYCRYCQGPS